MKKFIALNGLIIALSWMAYTFILLPRAEIEGRFVAEESRAPTPTASSEDEHLKKMAEFLQKDTRAVKRSLASLDPQASKASQEPELDPDRLLEKLESEEFRNSIRESGKFDQIVASLQIQISGSDRLDDKYKLLSVAEKMGEIFPSSGIRRIFLEQAAQYEDSDNSNLREFAQQAFHLHKEMEARQEREIQAPAGEP